jgi:acetyl-CoA C-acetyltransferase
MMSTPDLPALYGVGLVMQREDDPLKAREPLLLMIEAAQRAGEDCGAPGLLGKVERVYIPRGRWEYRDPGRAIARAIGAPSATMIVSEVGILQQSVIADAARRIARGEIDVALIVGGEAGHRLRTARKANVELANDQQLTLPDEIVKPDESPIRAEERETLGTDPGVFYALMEAAYRRRRSWTIEQSRDNIGDLLSSFSAKAVLNPNAWHRNSLQCREIRDVTEINRMFAFPYTVRHCSFLHVDQATALLLSSPKVAASAGVTAEPVFPWIMVESNALEHVSTRPDIGRSAGVDAVAEATMNRMGSAMDAVDLIDLYSCFPIAVQLFADAFRLPHDERLTVTGGMPFAGGPWNNYYLHSIGQTAQRLRDGDGRAALLTCVSGVLGKQGATLWGTEPPREGFEYLDVSASAAHASPRAVTNQADGSGTLSAYTVVNAQGPAPRTLALIDDDSGHRCIARTDDPDIAESAQTDELVGRRARIGAGTFELVV